MIFPLLSVIDIGFLNNSFSFLFFRLSLLLSKYSTNSKIPPSYLNSKDLDFFNENNAFDAEGRARLAKIIEEKRKETNDIQQENRILIEQRNLAAEKQSLEVKRDEEEARLTQEQILAFKRQEQKAEIAKQRENKEREETLDDSVSDENKSSKIDSTLTVSGSNEHRIMMHMQKRLIDEDPKGKQKRQARKKNRLKSICNMFSCRSGVFECLTLEIG